jgi:hypothetical protein
MRTDICVLNDEQTESREKALAEIDRMAAYNGLSHKESIQLRLLAEETIGMHRGVLGAGSSEFFADNEGSTYAIHLRTERRIDFDKREKLVDLSTSGKNAEYQGFKGKLKLIADTLLNDEASSMVNAGIDAEAGSCCAFWMPAACDRTWTFTQYKENTPEDNSENDELEHSILAKMADDIVVGVRNNMAEIIVIKKF